MQPRSVSEWYFKHQLETSNLDHTSSSQPILQQQNAKHETVMHGTNVCFSSNIECQRNSFALIYISSPCWHIMGVEQSPIYYRAVFIITYNGENRWGNRTHEIYRSGPSLTSWPLNSGLHNLWHGNALHYTATLLKAWCVTCLFWGGRGPVNFLLSH